MLKLRGLTSPLKKGLTLCNCVRPASKLEQASFTMTSCTALQTRSFHVPSAFQRNGEGRQHLAPYRGLLGRGISEWKQSMGALVCLSNPTWQQKAYTGPIAVKRERWRGAPWCNSARVCMTEASSMQSSAESALTMLEYDAGVGFPLGNGDYFSRPPSIIEGRIGPEVASTICALYKTEDLHDSVRKSEDPTEVGRASLTPWTAVVKSLSNFPGAAFEEAPVTGYDLPVLHLLEYSYVSDVLEKRGPYREAHLKLAAERCIVGGPKGDPIDGAFLLFGTDDKSVVEDFVSKDPYVAGGLVTAHRIRPWEIDCCNLNYFKGDSAETIPQEQATEVDLIEIRSRISSMSGFSKVDGKHKHRTWSWEVKSVNGRSLDVRARVPSGYSSLEQAALAAAADRFARGSVSCFLDIKMDKEQQDRRLVIDEDAMIQALEAMNRLYDHDAYRLPGEFDYGQLLQIPGVVRWEEPEESEEEKEEFVQKLTESLHDALDQLLASRAAEGDRLRVVLSGQVAELEALVEQAAVTAQERLPHLKDRMQKQVGELLETFRALDPGRLEQEVALLTTRLDVREEVDRLRSHIVAAKELLSGHHKQATSPKKGKDEEGSDRPLSIGRQLDFLCQEFTRECATICSKSNDVPLTQIAMQMRGVSEQIKEQAANVQ